MKLIHRSHIHRLSSMLLAYFLQSSKGQSFISKFIYATIAMMFRILSWVFSKPRTDDASKSARPVVHRTRRSVVDSMMADVAIAKIAFPSPLHLHAFFSYTSTMSVEKAKSVM